MIRVGEIQGTRKALVKIRAWRDFGRGRKSRRRLRGKLDVRNRAIVRGTASGILIRTNTLRVWMRWHGIKGGFRGVPRHLRLVGAVLTPGRRWGLGLIYTRVHRVWALVVSLGLVSYRMWGRVRLLERHTSRVCDGECLVTTQ